MEPKKKAIAGIMIATIALASVAIAVSAQSEGGVQPMAILPGSITGEHLAPDIDISTTGSGGFATLSSSGQYTNTVADGTTPMVITSTTKVANLNVDKLDDADWAAPAAIGSTTPAAGAFTTLSSSGQYTNTVADGTTPMVITSTTKVANLNVDKLDDADWAAPAAIGSGTPAAGTFTTLTANTDVVFNSMLAEPDTAAGVVPNVHAENMTGGNVSTDYCQVISDTTLTTTVSRNILIIYSTNLTAGPANEVITVKIEVAGTNITEQNIADYNTAQVNQTMVTYCAAADAGSSPTVAVFAKAKTGPATLEGHRLDVIGF